MTKYFYSLLPLYPRSKYTLSLTGLGNVVKLITWSFPDASLQKHTESIGNMGCILETVWYMYLSTSTVYFVCICFVWIQAV